MNNRNFFYSPVSFLRNDQAKFEVQQIENIECFGNNAHVFFRHLQWDSDYFSFPIYKIEFVDGDDKTLAQTFIGLKTELENRHSHYYLFGDIPSEDLSTLHALGNAGFSLVETRLTYFFNELQTFSWPERFTTRLADQSDIPNLRHVASNTRNNFDRYHADPFFSQIIADQYLATFIENSVNGFADFVLVPGNLSEKPNAFITVNIKNDRAQIVLVAVGEERRGWFLRLTSELIFLLQAKNINYIYMTTQSTNKAIIHVFEKLGWEYGRCSHMFSTYQ